MNEIIWNNWKAGKPTWIIVVKDRQIGISTDVAMVFNAICQFVFGIRCLMLADFSDNSDKLFRMHKTTYEEFNPEVRSGLKANNAKILEFIETKSIVYVDSAENERPGMSTTFQLIHCSEVAHWKRPNKAMLSLLQAVPVNSRTIVVLESTANGVGNFFHKTVKDAEKKKNQYTLIFFSYVEHDEYSMPLPEDYELVPTEYGEYGNEIEVIEHCKKFGITDRQKQLEKLYWRRWTIINKCDGNILNFQQEYPLTVDEAFIGSGMPVFDAHKLTHISEKSVNIPSYYAYINTQTKDIKFDIVKFQGFNLSVWHLPDPLTDRNGVKINRYSHRYLVSADTGGVWDGADWSEAYVYDRLLKRVCANIHTHIDPYIYADQLIQLCKFYENAHLVIEINKWSSEVDDQGETVVNYVKDKYSNLYTHEIIDDETKELTHKIGFHTNAQTKGLVIDALREYVEEWDSNPIICNDSDFIDQMRTYVYLQTKTGKTSWGASEGEKDDKVMAFGIMLAVSKGMSPVKEIKPIITEERNENYIERLV